MPQAVALSVSLAGALAGGCNALWGVDSLEYVSPNGGAAGAGTPSGGGTGGAGGAGATGGGGASGGSCTPDVVRECYSGPPATQAFSPCHAGWQMCNATGTGFGPCEGEVVPTAEICGDGLDQDCNGADATACLVGDGLVVRYPIDEAASGQGPTELRDTAPDPQPLTLEYDNGFEFDEDASHRGLWWQDAQLGGRASYTAASGKAATMLDGSTTVTIELVIRLEQAASSGSPLMYFGTSVGMGQLALWADPNRYKLYWHTGEQIGEWDLPQASTRNVLHAVIDSGAAAGDRVRCYSDGVRLSGTAAFLTQVQQGDTLSFAAGPFALGNRAANGTESMKGRLFYAALYASALSDQAIANNAMVLAESDDFL